jgi:glutamyl-tRNA synthetase/glutamyl-Q tRNA(Asp) synthetase
VTVTRFAPAPTGYLHLGHVVNAIYVWGLARARGGRVLLRIEDHDRTRCRPEYERAIVEDLEWLGFVPDEPLIRQSERGTIYESALQQLREQGLVYACGCSRADLAMVRQEGAAEVRYPGTCAGKHLREAPGLGLRVRLAPAVERAEDLRHGWLEQRPSEQCGDLLVKDRAGNWTYQFAAAVDDYVQGVSLVIRGEDLLPSTGRQLQIARLLGRRELPQFFHHALIMKTPEQKLSKSDGDTSIRAMREAGYAAPAVIGRAAVLAGLLPAIRDVAAAEVSSMMAP